MMAALILMSALIEDLYPIRWSCDVQLTDGSRRKMRGAFKPLEKRLTRQPLPAGMPSIIAQDFSPPLLGYFAGEIAQGFAGFDETTNVSFDLRHYETWARLGSKRYRIIWEQRDLGNPTNDDFVTIRVDEIALPTAKSSKRLSQSYMKLFAWGSCSMKPDIEERAQ